MSLNPIAENYKLVVADYERGRPGYPEPIIDALPLEAVATVVDLAAGTGKFTRLLLPRLAPRAKVIAVEPVAEIVAGLAPLPSVSIIQSTAAGTADLVMCAQAFHWFDDETTVAEITRIMRPAGTLALVWNLLDQCVPWAKALSQPDRQLRRFDSSSADGAVAMDPSRPAVSVRPGGHRVQPPCRLVPRAARPGILDQLPRAPTGNQTT